MQNNRTTWAVIGGGNGGQSAAAHLGIMGFNVRLYDINQDTVDKLNDFGGIKIDGSVEGFGKLQFATMDMAKAIDGADVIMVVTPALAHRAVAKEMAKYLVDNQIIFIHPGATGGALEFKQVFNEYDVKAKVSIAESMSLIYACRLNSPGHATIFGIKETLLTGVLPSKHTQKVLSVLNEAFEVLSPAKNVLHTSLENLNTAVHAAPTLLNTSLIESDRNWLYYWDGITPSIGDFAVQIDNERIEIGKSLGIDLIDVKTWYNKLYGVTGDTLTELVRNNNAYRGIKGQTTLETRYLLEDIPCGIIPMISLAKLLNVKTDRMSLIVNLAQYLLKRDLYSNARTLDKLGLEDMTKEEILNYVETGERELAADNI